MELTLDLNSGKSSESPKDILSLPSLFPLLPLSESDTADIANTPTPLVITLSKPSKNGTSSTQSIFISNCRLNCNERGKVQHVTTRSQSLVNSSLSYLNSSCSVFGIWASPDFSSLWWVCLYSLCLHGNGNTRKLSFTTHLLTNCFRNSSRRLISKKRSSNRAYSL